MYDLLGEQAISSVNLKTFLSSSQVLWLTSIALAFRQGEQLAKKAATTFVDFLTYIRWVEPLNETFWSPYKLRQTSMHHHLDTSLLHG